VGGRLLAVDEPERIEREYQRRLEAKHAGTPTASFGSNGHAATVRRGIARLIDGYENGWLEADEFEAESGGPGSTSGSLKLRPR